MATGDTTKLACATAAAGYYVAGSGSYATATGAPPCYCNATGITGKMTDKYLGRTYHTLERIMIRHTELLLGSFLGASTCLVVDHSWLHTAQ